MTQTSSIMKALEHFLFKVNKEEKEKIWLEVKAMNIKGPPIGDFLECALKNKPISFNFQEDIGIYSGALPPTKSLKLSIQTLKFSLESFFL